MIRSRGSLYVSVTIISIVIIVYFSFINDQQNFPILKEVKPIRIIKIGDMNTTSFTTLVTVMFNVKKSKHKYEEYEKCFKTMIKSIKVPLIAFVDTKWQENFVDHSRKYNLTGKVNFTFSSFIKIEYNYLEFSF